MAAYATAADLIARRDERFVGQLVTDHDEPLTTAEILVSDKIETALEDASGEVEAAMLAGKRYSVAELSGLTGNSLGLLKRIVCTIAIANLLERRPTINAEQAKFYFDQAQAYLKALRTGENLFNLADLSNVEAAVPDTEGPTSVDYATINFLPDQMIRHFPDRIDRLPLDRG